MRTAPTSDTGRDGPEGGNVDETAQERDAARTDAGFRELEIVAYVGDLKVVGFAHFGVAHRATSRRPSDYLRAFGDTRLTLSQVRLYKRGSQELVDTAPFVLLNLDKVDLIYAHDEVEEDPPSAGG
jgi:hypothetical protein